MVVSHAALRGLDTRSAGRPHFTERTNPSLPRPPRAVGENRGQKKPDRGGNETPQTPSTEELRSIDPSEDRFIADYLLFLSTLDDEGRGRAQLERLRDLERRLKGVQDAAPEQSASAQTAYAAEVRYTESAFLGVVTDGSAGAFVASLSAEFSASVATSVTAADNGAIASVSQSIEVQLEMSLQISANVAQPVQQADPLALDLDGDNKISLTDVGAGATFDINADSFLDRSAFVTGHDAFLALDRNANGRIDDGSELFGDQHGAANGFLELGRYDDNGDGLIDARDGVFSSLLAVTLGSAGALEQRRLTDLGVQAIELGYRDTALAAEGGNTIGQLGAFRRVDGSTGLAADINLNYSTIV